MYRRLDPGRIAQTAQTLASRVGERFPEAGLRSVAKELVGLADQVTSELAWFARPHWPLRVGVGLCIALLVVVFVVIVGAVLRLPTGSTGAEVIQAIDAGVSELVFLGAAIFFLSTVEVRRKRSRALKSLHQLRSMAHIIDMHQLSKDPERVINPTVGSDTLSSPKRTFTAFELSRYLDYCSEMLSLLSKLAALYVQDFDDPATVTAVNEIENLTSGLSRKIWQKIMIVDRELAT